MRKKEIKENKEKTVMMVRDQHYSNAKFYIDLSYGSEVTWNEKTHIW
jgi:hypothetical protein